MNSLTVYLIVAVGLFGTVIGSFLNVVIWRLPRGESLSHPASHCPNCGHAIRPWDNIPVISWLVLRGKCRDCGEPISWRYPAVELGVGVFFAGVALWAVLTGIPHAPFAAFVLTLVAYLYLAAISVALAFIDIETHKLPNKIVLPAYVVGAVLLVASSIISAHYGALLSAGIGALGLLIAYFLMVLIYPPGMGLGDVKLAGVLGLFLGWLGWGSLAVGAFMPFLLGGVFAIALLLAKRAGRKTRIPFGPWMLAGAWAGIFCGRELSNWYLGLFGLA